MCCQKKYIYTTAQRCQKCKARQHRKPFQTHTNTHINTRKHTHTHAHKHTHTHTHTNIRTRAVQSAKEYTILTKIPRPCRKQIINHIYINMYRCVYCIYIYIYVQSTCVDTNVYMYIFMKINKYKYLYIYNYKYGYIYTKIYGCKFICIYINTNTYIYV